MTEDLSRSCCPNLRCPDHGRQGIGNLTACAHHVKGKKRRMLSCRSCKARSSEREGDSPVWFPVDRGEGRLDLRTSGRTQRRPGHRRAGEGGPQHRGPPHPARRRSCPPTPRRGRGCFPRVAVRSSPTRNGPMSPRSGPSAPDEPADDPRGDCRDHVAIDPESRQVLVVVPGPRDVEAVEEVVGEAKRRTGGRILDLGTGDEYPAYGTALPKAYGEEATTTATGRRARKMVPGDVPPAGMNHATVERRRVRGSSGRDRDASGLRDDGWGGGGPGKIERESANQHLVRGASGRDGPASRRPEGAEDLDVL